MAMLDSLKKGMGPITPPLGYMPPEFAGLFPGVGAPSIGPLVPRVPQQGDFAPNDPSGPGGFGGGTAAPTRLPRVPLAPVSSAPQVDQPGDPGIDKSKQGPAERHGLGGFIQRFGHRLGEMARTGELQLRLQMSDAMMRGDTSTAAQLGTHIAALRTQQQQTQAAAATRQSIASNLMKGAPGRPPMEAADVELAMADPEHFLTEYNTRFRTRDVSPGAVLNTPNLSGAPTIWQAPIAAEQAARAANIPPGTPAYNTFIQDFALNAQGPTGTETTRRGQDITRRNNVDSNATSRANNANSNATSRANNADTTATTRRGQDLTTGRIERGQNLTDTRVRGSAAYQGRHAGRTVAAEGQIVVNPQTGERRVVRNGQLVPVR